MDKCSRLHPDVMLAGKRCFFWRSGKTVRSPERLTSHDQNGFGPLLKLTAKVNFSLCSGAVSGGPREGPSEGAFPLPTLKTRLHARLWSFQWEREHLQSYGELRGRREKSGGLVGNHFPIRMKSEPRLSDSLMLPLRCSDDGDRCVAGSLTSPLLFDHEQNMNVR